MMLDYKTEYDKWINSPALSAEERAELAGLDDSEKQSRFSCTLNFGTAGIRGIMACGPGRMNVFVVRQVTQGLARLIQRENAVDRGVAISYDSRNNSRNFAGEAARVLAANGIKTYFFDAPRPTPELSFAVRHFGCIAGINITASHNPKEYNGYKVYWEDGAQLSPQKSESLEQALSEADPLDSRTLISFDEALASREISMLGEETDNAYLSHVLAQSVNSEPAQRLGEDFAVVYTPFHGTGSKLVPEVLRRAGFRRVLPVMEQMVQDGGFSTVRCPNPEERDSFELAVSLAEQNAAAVIIGTDPDADRAGVMAREHDGKYRLLTGNQTAALLLNYLIGARRRAGKLPPQPYVVKSIVSTDLAKAICQANGIALYEVFTGFRFIAEKMNSLEENGKACILAFEESGGYLTGNYCRDKDAVAASLLIAEMTAYHTENGMSLTDALEDIYRRYGRYEEETVNLTITGADALQRMNRIMSRLRSGDLMPAPELKLDRFIDFADGKISGPGAAQGEKSTISGADVICFEFVGGSKLFVRPSGTEPKMKVYLMAKGSDSVEINDRIRLMRIFSDNIKEEGKLSE